MRQLRDAEGENAKLLAERRRLLHEEVKKRVLEATALDAKLDAAEEQSHAQERKEGAKQRAVVARAVEAAREEQLERRRCMAKEIRSLAERASVDVPASVVALAQQRGQEKRDAAKQVWEVALLPRRALSCALGRPLSCLPSRGHVRDSSLLNEASAKKDTWTARASIVSAQWRHASAQKLP